MANKNNIIRSEQDGVEFFTNQETGESGMSQSGLARLCGVSQQAIKEILRTAATGQTRSRWLKDLQGQDCELQECSYKNIKPIKAEVCAKIIKHYAFSGNAEAQYALDKFAEAGVNQWIQGINGWQKKAQEPRRGIGAYSQRVSEMFNSVTNMPADHWCVLEECSRLLIHVEGTLGLPVDKADLLDGSVGKCWSNYRKGKSWAKDRIEFTYKFPDGNTVYPWAYQNSELLEFRRWLKDDYQPNFLPGYLKRKYGALVKV